MRRLLVYLLDCDCGDVLGAAHAGTLDLDSRQVWSTWIVMEILKPGGEVMVPSRRLLVLTAECAEKTRFASAAPGPTKVICAKSAASPVGGMETVVSRRGSMAWSEPVAVEIGIG